MEKKKLNCWEYMECERHPDGNKTNEVGVCPASFDNSFDGINFGKTQEESVGQLPEHAAEEKYKELMPRSVFLVPVVNFINWFKIKKAASCQVKSF